MKRSTLINGKCSIRRADNFLHIDYPGHMCSILINKNDLAKLVIVVKAWQYPENRNITFETENVRFLCDRKDHPDAMINIVAECGGILSIIYIEKSDYNVFSNWLEKESNLDI